MSNDNARTRSDFFFHKNILN